MDIIIERRGRETSLGWDGDGNATLLAYLRDAGVPISAPCGGHGKCGKCRARFTQGAPNPTEAERRCFTEGELADGWRLSCESVPTGDCHVILPEDEGEFEVVAEFGSGASQVAQGGDLAVAVDLGTTTIAASLIDSGGSIVHTVTMVNSQRAFGADVVSRIQASNEGHAEELEESVRMDLYGGIARLLSESGANAGHVSRIAIAGNTTMGHLLMGDSCETLGAYPFKPVDISTRVVDASGFFAAQRAKAGADEIDLTAKVEVLPGISAYVGADLAAGLLFCGFDRLEEPCLLIDFGTNGEMALGNRDRILVASTAAGPAFEGGNLSCGMGSVPGAICNVSIEDGHPHVRTIGGKPPIGICGTGVVEAVHELLVAGFLDETGMLAETYFEEGFPLAETAEGKPIVLTQKDVREIQLAKAAVRAGVETLLKRSGITYADVGHVFLAGGFGYRIDFTKAAGIGMLPREWANRATAVGNSALGGAIAWLAESDARQRLERLIGVCEEVGLALDADFNDFYVDHMLF